MLLNLQDSSAGVVQQLMVEVADLRRQLAEAAGSARGTATVAASTSNSSSRAAAAAAVVYVIDPAVTDELERLHALVGYSQTSTHKTYSSRQHYVRARVVSR
jgi:butyrate kinase